MYFKALLGVAALGYPSAFSVFSAVINRPETT
jgi:hypothetical protein